MYETFEHKADIGVRGIGNSLEAAFQEAAKAMFSVMYDIGMVGEETKISIDCEADDRELLLVEWLNALLAEAGVNGMAFSNFHVGILDEHLHGTAWGEKINLKKHMPKTEVKAATYSGLKVCEKDGAWTAQCIVDV